MLLQRAFLTWSFVCLSPKASKSQDICPRWLTIHLLFLSLPLLLCRGRQDWTARSHLGQEEADVTAKKDAKSGGSGGEKEQDGSVGQDRALVHPTVGRSHDTGHQ